MSLILYILQVTCCLAFFYGFYHLTLRKETLFETNRFYLVTTLAASIVLPLIKIYIDASPSDPVLFIAPSVSVGSYVDALSANNAISQNTPFPWDKLIMGIYFLGISVMAIRFINAVKDIQWIRMHGTKTMVEGHYCILSEKVNSPFSFFNSIYFPKHHQFDESELKEIVAHELAHVKGRHTLDILLMEAACILLWPSPLIYVYRKALKDVHEFVADAAVIRDTPWEHYAQLLVDQQQGQLQNILSNQLIYSQLKKRLRMMNQEKSGFAARFKYLGIIPVVLIALVLFSFREKPSSHQVRDLVQNNVQVRDTVTLLLTNDKRIFLGSHEVKKDEIESTVKDLTKNMPDPIVILLLENPSNVTVGEIGEILEVGSKMHMQWVLYTNDEAKLNVAKSAVKEGEFVFVSDTLPASIGADKKIQPYTYVEEMPRYNGCEDILDPSERFKCTMDKLFEFVNENIQYPAKDKANRIEGQGIVQFVVEADGSLSNIRVLRSPSPTIAAEILRMMNVMASIQDAWIPGKLHGVAVPVVFTLPVKFFLNDKVKELTPGPVSYAEPFAYVEEMPRFNGCEDIEELSEKTKCSNSKLYDFVYKNIQYPAQDKEKKIEGHGIVQFVVEADGSLSDIRVLRSPSQTIAAEIMRMMNVMAAIPDAWLPGKHNGVTVPVTFTLPVKFKLQDEQQISAIESKATTGAVSSTIVKVIPNPAQESITVTIFKDTHTLKIFDTAGMLMITQKVTSSSANNETINIAALKPGQYVVQVISDKESVSASFAVVN